MRNRFKFRVWDKENFNYLEFEGFKKGEIEFNFDINTNSIWIEFDHNKYILEQCTGLKDKNGKLIYEGDIVERDHVQGKKQGVVVFDKEALQFRATNMSLYSFVHRSVVIGNICENPELLESN